MQLLELPPSHIVLPAIGVRREEVGALFEREFGTEHGNSDPTYLTHEARRQLRPKFLGADIAMTGVNFAVASTGRWPSVPTRGMPTWERRSPTCISPSWGWRRLSPTCGR